MGNWRTARIIGTCDVGEVSALRFEVQRGHRDIEAWGPLTAGSGLCGLGDWTGAAFDRVGNLAERNYDERSVAEHLEQIAKAAPSLKCKVHLGGEYESKDVVAVISLEGGKATVGPVEDVATLEIPAGQMESNLLSTLFAAQKR